MSELSPSQVPFTTVADFILSAGEEVIRPFLDMLLVCDRMGRGIDVCNRWGEDVLQCFQGMEWDPKGLVRLGS